jgi:secreted trypsin-like serine protease
LGAPLMMKTGNCWHVIGILSHGLGCSMFPEIYTDTAKYLPWITKNLRHHFDSQDTFLKT